MPLTKEQLVYFPGDQGDSDNVGAYLTDAAGNLLTSTLVSGKQALDVNITNSITTTPEADTAPATQNITTQDLATTSTTVANGEVFYTGTPTAGSAATFTVSSQESVEVLVTGTWTGTLQTEFSIDGGTTWFVRGIKQAGASYISSSFTANFAGGSNVTGATNYRVRAIAAMTGTATVKVVISINNASITVTNPLTLRDSTVQSITNTIKAASTAALATDTSLVVALSPNTPLPTGSNTIGAVTQGTTPWVDNLTQVGGSSITLGQKTSAASLPVVIASDQSTINVSAAQSGTWTVQQGTPPWSVVGNVADGVADSGDPVKTGTRSVVGVLTSPIATTNERADMVSDRYRRLYINDGADIAARNTSISVTSTATALPAALGGRRSLMVQNNGSKAIYIGSSAAVTTTNGLTIPASSTLEVSIGEDVTLYAITSAASQPVILFELA
jgi:hypothetical protein